MSDLEIINKMKELDKKVCVDYKEIVKRELEITKEDFEDYEDCRISGLTNMFNLSNVELITGLSKKKIKAIIKNYNKLKEEFKG